MFVFCLIMVLSLVTISPVFAQEKTIGMLAYSRPLNEIDVRSATLAFKNYVIADDGSFIEGTLKTGFNARVRSDGWIMVWTGAQPSFPLSVLFTDVDRDNRAILFSPTSESTLKDSMKMILADMGNLKNEFGNELLGDVFYYDYDYKVDRIYIIGLISECYSAGSRWTSTVTFIVPPGVEVVRAFVSLYWKAGSWDYGLTSLNDVNYNSFKVNEQILPSGHGPNVEKINFHDVTEFITLGTNVAVIETEGRNPGNREARFGIVLLVRGSPTYGDTLVVSGQTCAYAFSSKEGDTWRLDQKYGVPIEKRLVNLALPSLTTIQDELPPELVSPSTVPKLGSVMGLGFWPYIPILFAPLIIVWWWRKRNI